jgi:hypothetical protein
VIWRSAIVASYLALAMVVGVAYGPRGFAILCFFYFCATAWMAFLLPWGSLARAAGRWNVRRLETPPTHDDVDDSHPRDGDPEVVPDSVALQHASLRARRRKRQPAPAL